MNANFAVAPLSLSALNDIAEERAGTDPGFRRDGERRGRPLLSQARKLPDEALREKLERWGIEIDKNSYAEIAEHAISAEEIAETAVTAEVRARFRGAFEADWIWLALTVLWERWFPEWPNLEQLDQQMQAGYALLKKDSAGACELWLPAWQDFLLMFDHGSFKTVAEFDNAFRGTQFVSNWLCDLEMGLGNAARADAKWHERRIQFCEEYLRKFADENQLTRENMRRALAEATFGTRDRARGDALYDQWLKADLQWGWGWIGWADNYSIGAPGPDIDLPRAETLLRQGIKVSEVRDREYLLERLSHLCAEQGRDEEAKAFQAESETLRASERNRSLKPGVDVGKELDRLEQLTVLAKQLREKREQLAASAAAAKLPKIGRNNPCPCGSGKKYKKCCLAKDEAATRKATLAARVPPVIQPDEAPIPTPPAGLWPGLVADVDAEPLGGGTQPPEIERKLDELWDAFEALPKPTTEEMDTFLNQLLELPAAATKWGELFHRLAHAGHPELPAVFRRIGGKVAPTAGHGMAFFYWAAAEALVHHGHAQMLPEIAAGFRQLTVESYDPDALWHLMDWLLAGNFEAETLELVEHFLPILQADGRLMPYTVPEACQVIFELRVGAYLREDKAPEPDVIKIAEALRRNMEEIILPDAARAAAAFIASGPPVTPLGRAEFELVLADISADKGAGEDLFRLYRAQMQVAREAWQIEQRLPGCALCGLTMMLNSVYRALVAGGKKPKKASPNWLDYLQPAGLEARLVRSCRDLIGLNEPRTRRMLDAHNVLLRFAMRHQLLSKQNIDRAQQKLDHLAQQLNEGTAAEGEQNCAVTGIHTI